MEPRALLATIVVTGTGDTIDANDGMVTLREALTAASSNAVSGDAIAGDPGLDRIEFNIPGGGVRTITLGADADFPAITEAVFIDGYTQPEASANTNPSDQPDNAAIRVRLDGSLRPTGGLLIRSGSGTTIRGLDLTNFQAGVNIDTAASGNQIVGNFIGVDPSGTTALGNTLAGVFIASPNNTIGGTTPADRNVISGNATGIEVLGPGNLIVGNFIGTTASGTSGLGKSSDLAGIYVQGEGSETTIGGTTAAERNVISGNGQFGIQSTAVRLLVQGNYVGVDRTGLAPLVNNAGIRLFGTTGPRNDTIGGTADGAGNVIASRGSGIDLTSFSTVIEGVLIQGNAIGTDPTGTAVLGNSVGIDARGARNITIGGTAAGAGNLIANTDASDAGAGVRVYLATVLGNSIFGNAGPGIEGPQGPFLTDASTTAIMGRLLAPAGLYRLEFFATPDSGPTSSNEGKTYIGTLDVTIGGVGNGTEIFTFSPAGGVPTGQFLTATSTGPDGTTSAFSGAVMITAAAPVADIGVTVADSPDPVTPGTDLTYTIIVTNNGPDAAQDVALTATLPEGVTFVSLATPAGWVATTPSVGASGTITATIAGLAVGPGAATFTLVARVDPLLAAGTTVSTTVEVDTTTADPNSANDTTAAITTLAAVTPPVPPDLQVVVADAPDPVAAGGNLAYTLAVTNISAGEATGVILTAATPAGTTFVSFVAPAGWAVTAPAIGGTGAITAAIASLGGAGASSPKDFTLIVRVDPGTAGGSTLNFSARVASESSDANPGDNSASATTTVAITPPANTAPSASPDAYTTAAGQALVVAAKGILSNDTDPENDPLSVVVETGPAHGTLALNPDGSFTYTPASGFSGIDSFTYLASDGLLASAPVTVTLTVAVGPVTPPPLPGTDTTGPSVAGLQRFGFHAQPTHLVLAFDEALAQAGASRRSNFRLVAAGEDGRFGTRDDVVIALRSAMLAADGRTIRLATRHPLPLRHHYQLTVGGLTDLAGNAQAGGAAVLRFNRSILAGPSAFASAARHRPAATLARGNTGRAAPR